MGAMQAGEAGRKKDDNTLTVEEDPFLPGASQNDVFTTLQALIFAGGFYALPCLTMLPVFIGPKVAASGAFTLTEFSSSQACFFAGWAVTAAIMVPLSDIIGRKPIALALVVPAFLAQQAAFHVASPVAFQGCYFFVGFMASASQVGYLLCQESLPPDVRANALVGLNGTCSVLTILMALSCKYLTRDLSWQMETAIYYIPYAFLALCLPYCTKETLNSQLFALPKVKGVASLASPSPGRGGGSVGGGGGSFDLLYKQYLPTLLYTSICWMACAMSFFGLSFSAGNFSSDLYMNIVLLATVDLLSNLVAGKVATKFGDCQAQMMSFAGAGGVLIFLSIAPRWIPGLLMVGAMVGRLFVNIAFFTVYKLMLEHFPKECRSTACGLVNFVSRIAATTAPMCAVLDPSISLSLLGSVCMMATFATSRLQKLTEAQAAASSC